mmetsp:Transcript_94214/g.275547  ORF Transcript_94214/g.275547 Transcript_94214/m.275547 type:complete len:219 (-) Transcript_94214:551-1207(-)
MSRTCTVFTLTTSLTKLPSVRRCNSYVFESLSARRALHFCSCTSWQRFMRLKVICSCFFIMTGSTNLPSIMFKHACWLSFSSCCSLLSFWSMVLISSLTLPLFIPSSWASASTACFLSCHLATSTKILSCSQNWTAFMTPGVRIMTTKSFTVGSSNGSRSKPETASSCGDKASMIITMMSFMPVTTASQVPSCIAYLFLSSFWSSPEMSCHRCGSVFV